MFGLSNFPRNYRAIIGIVQGLKTAAKAYRLPRKTPARLSRDDTKK